MLPVVALLAGLLAAEARPDVTVRTYDTVPHGATVLLGRTGDVAVWDVTDTDRPIERHRLPLPATVLALAVDSDRAVAAAGSHGLYVLGLDPETGEPELVSRFDTPGFVRDVLLDGGRAILADDRYGIRVLDLDESPSRPRQIALVPTRDKVLALARDGAIAASAEGQAGVRLWHLRAQGLPREIELVTDLGAAQDVALSAGLLLVAAGREGLIVFRSRENRETVRIATLRLGEPAERVAAANDVAWVSTGTPTLERIDLSDPAHPVRLEPLRLHRSAPVGRVRVEPGRLLAAVDTAGLGLIDLSRPDEPAVLLPRERTLRILD